MKSYLVVWVVNNHFNSSVHFYSKIVSTDTISNAVMQIQNERCQVINIIPLGYLD